MTSYVWVIAVGVYALAALLTGIPIIKIMVKKVIPENVPDDIASHPDLSEKAKRRISDNYKRLAGSLGFWKLRAKQNRWLTTYVTWWAIPSSIAIPIIVQSSDSEGAKLMITCMSAYSAILLVMAQRLRSEINFRAYREGESAFYDTFRALMDAPSRFGDSEDEQLVEYFVRVERIRQAVREGELSSLAKLES